jgi:hypothetical protein
MARLLANTEASERQCRELVENICLSWRGRRAGRVLVG